MKIFFVLLSVVASHQLCHGALRDFPGCLAEDEKCVIYSYEQMIVVKVTGRTGRVHRCQVFEAYKEDEGAELTRELEWKLKLKVKKIDMKKMMSTLADCDSVDERDGNGRSNTVEDIFSAIGHNIYPGTKWCGMGNIAKSYHDLGKYRGLDRCCRSHDLCPVKVLSKETRYNITNDSGITRSHCTCDKAFYDCLKNVEKRRAEKIGKIYFKLVKPHCVIGVPGNTGEKIEFVPAPYEW